jgi:hypothetical protein
VLELGSQEPLALELGSQEPLALGLERRGSLAQEPQVLELGSQEPLALGLERRGSLALMQAFQRQALSWLREPEGLLGLRARLVQPLAS